VKRNEILQFIKLEGGGDMLYSHLTKEKPLKKIFGSMTLLFSLCFCILVSFPAASYSAIITVGSNGKHPTIQEAIDSSKDGDEIIVSPGNYVENIRFTGKNIILRSEDPTSTPTVAATIIDGNQAGSVVTFDGTELTTCVLSGFTITNGLTDRYGGGINGGEIMPKTNATIQYNIITDNAAKSSGGGISYCDGTISNNTISGNSGRSSGGGLYGCEGTISNNTISGNTAKFGGGIFECNGRISNNIISENSADNGGGLIHCDGTIDNNLISANSAIEYGGGLYYCHATISNNTISANSADEGGGLSNCKYAWIVNCIIWENSSAISVDQIDKSSTPTCSCIQDWTGGGIGNISSDPSFIDPSSGDFHLKADSPCIDKGYPLYHYCYIGDEFHDIYGECRLSGSTVDIGADEYGSSIDTDGDLISDDDEVLYGTNKNIRDTDGDGLYDFGEIIRGTNPAVFNNPGSINVPLDFQMIQEAIFCAFPGEIITVDQGIYYENLYFGGKNFILQSTNPENETIRTNTVIDGRKYASVIRLKGTEDETCIIQGLTLRNGYSFGGGINGNYSLALISNNTISGNSALFGGGIFWCNGIISNNTISGNTASVGGGLAGCDGIIINNTISENSAEYGGGVCYCYGTVCNNIISGNSAKYGSGLYFCEGTIKNNTISYNSAEYRGGGIYGCNYIISNNTISENSAGSYGGGIYSCNSQMIINCIIWENSADISGNQIDKSSTPTYSCIQDWTGGGIGNISPDPKFEVSGSNLFYLKPDSPCIDSGNPETEYNDGCFPPGQKTDRNDMGAYGGPLNCGWDVKKMLVSYISDYILGKTLIPPTFANQNEDGIINVADIVFIIYNANKN
jgi:hypothetical protein